MNRLTEECFDMLADVAEMPVELLPSRFGPIDDFPSFTMFTSRDHTWAFCGVCGRSCIRLDGVPVAEWVLAHKCEPTK